MKKITVFFGMLMLFCMSVCTTKSSADTIRIYQDSLRALGYKVIPTGSTSESDMYMQRRNLAGSDYIWRTWVKFSLDSFYAIDSNISAEDIISATYSVESYHSGDVPINVYAMGYDSATMFSNYVQDWNKGAVQASDIPYSDYVDGFTADVTDSLKEDVENSHSHSSLLITLSDESVYETVRFNAVGDNMTYLDIEYNYSPVPEPLTIVLLLVSLFGVKLFQNNK